MRWSACQWAGHLFLPYRLIWGQHSCLRCGLIRNQSGPAVEYVTVRPR